VELREFRAELPSTQTEAVRRARDGAPEGSRVVAASQTLGVGRGDHTWSSPPGNLYFSVILRAPATHRNLLSLAVGARLRSALADHLGIACVLKWPNDLLVVGSGSPRKLAGVLVDLVPSPELGLAAVVGVGLNVAAPPSAYPTSLRDRVVSLHELTRSAPDLRSVEEFVVTSVRSAVAALDTPTGPDRILAECRTSLYGRGRSASVDATRTGIIRTVGDDGALWLDTPEGAIAVHFGEVVVEAD
jgi:BirA family biotin operon repressor/biotin-[acetyl-CoA-carboxylase] ligase